MNRLAFIAIAFVCVCPICSAQVKDAPNVEASEANVVCPGPLETEPLTPYGFAKATLVSLWHARNAAQHSEDLKKETREATTYFSFVTAMMRVTKTSTNDFICAKRPIKPFNAKQSGEDIQTAAQFLLIVYDQHIDINHRLIEILKKMDTISQPELMDQFSTLQVERGQRWADLVQPVQMTLVLLIDPNRTDKNGNVDHLLVTKSERQGLIAWADEHFPEFKNGTPKDKWSDPAKTAQLYFAFFGARKCSDE